MREIKQTNVLNTVITLSLGDSPFVLPGFTCVILAEMFQYSDYINIWPVRFTEFFSYLTKLCVVSSHKYTIATAESKMGLEEAGRGLLVGRRSATSEGED